MATSAAEAGAIYETVMPLLASMYEEFRELSKKKPDAPISKVKIQVVNRLLTKIRIVLAQDEALEFLDLFDADDIPQTSDVAIMLSQYVAAMSAFKEKHYVFDRSDHKWQWK